MHFWFRHNYDGVEFKVECEYDINTISRIKPIVEWEVLGFKDVREIVVSTRVHESELQEEIFNLTADIEDECIKIGQKAEREMLEDCFIGDYLNSGFYI